MRTTACPSHPRFDVPLVADQDHAGLLMELSDHILSVHCSLGLEQRTDCRVAVPPEDPATLRDLLELVGRAGHVRRHALLNSTFYAPRLLHQDLGLIIDPLDRLAGAGLIEGIVCCDHYLLQALGSRAPSLAASLEALPGINCRIDTPARLRARLEAIAEAGFRLPSQVVLDRSVNRDPQALEALVRERDRLAPGLELGLLANEGCLAHCPFATAHGAHIAHANATGAEHTFYLNQELGCVRVLGRHPERILASPFIRPEDLDLYQGLADYFKLCGRTLGPAFLSRALRAWTRGSFQGNLLDLLDAPHWLAAQCHIDNQALPPDFGQRLMHCGQDCADCDYCARVFARAARPAKGPDLGPSR